MMSMLPPDFHDLEPLAAIWALPTEHARSEKRWSSTPAEFEAIYDAMIDRIEDIMTYLDQYSLDSIPDTAKPLYYLALAFAETSPHIELYKSQAEVPNSFDAHRFVASHGAVVE